MIDLDSVMCLLMEVFGAVFHFFMSDFRGGQEWMMYNHFSARYTVLLREIGCYLHKLPGGPYILNIFV